jgi:hypothetical protein
MSCLLDATYHPRLQSSINLLHPRISRYRNDWYMSYNVAFSFQFSNLSCTCQAIHNRHLEIHQYHTKLQAVIFVVNPEPRLLEASYAFTSVISDVDCAAEISKLLL